MGFTPFVPDTVYKKKLYLAGEDRERAGVINRLFSENRIKGILCARGGFGAIRVLPLLDWQVIRKHPKPFVGFSDISALLVSLVPIPLMPVLHGPVITSMAEAARETLDSLFTTLTIGTDGVNAEDPVIIREGRAAGILSGGNLSTLNHLVGTRFQPDFSGCILFLEDIGEAPYKIDRMLSQMKMAGLFAGVKGVVLGSFENCGNVDMIFEIVEEIFHEFTIPVMAGFEAGHGKVNHTLPFGVEALVDTKLSGISWKV